MKRCSCLFLLYCAALLSLSFFEQRFEPKLDYNLEEVQKDSSEQMIQLKAWVGNCGIYGMTIRKSRKMVINS